MNRQVFPWITMTLAVMALFQITSVFAGDVQELDATRVRFLPGSPFYDRQELHRQGYLASCNPDSQLFHYRAQA